MMGEKGCNFAAVSLFPPRTESGPPILPFPLGNPVFLHRLLFCRLGKASLPHVHVPSPSTVQLSLILSSLTNVFTWTLVLSCLPSSRKLTPFTTIVSQLLSSWFEVSFFLFISVGAPLRVWRSWTATTGVGRSNSRPESVLNPSSSCPPPKGDSARLLLFYVVVMSSEVLSWVAVLWGLQWSI